MNSPEHRRIGADAFSGTPDPILREEYDRHRFVEVEGVVDSAALERIVTPLLEPLLPYTGRIIRPHEVSTGFMHEGRRFNRIDPGYFEGGAYTPGVTPEEARAAVARAFSVSGLDSFATRLVARSQHWVEELVGRRLRYDRCFLLTYGEGDFIAPHGDTQTSRRVMLQTAVTLHCQTAMRAMRNGWMELSYDAPGLLRVHGPGIWHEVLPVQRPRPSTGEPVRILLTARLEYADD